MFFVVFLTHIIQAKFIKEKLDSLQNAGFFVKLKMTNPQKAFPGDLNYSNV